MCCFCYQLVFPINYYSVPEINPFHHLLDWCVPKHESMKPLQAPSRIAMSNIIKYTSILHLRKSVYDQRKSYHSQHPSTSINEESTAKKKTTHNIEKRNIKLQYIGSLYSLYTRAIIDSVFANVTVFLCCCYFAF